MKNLKRLMSVVLSVVMLLSFVISTSAATFTDVAETDKSFQAIEVLAALKILEGKEAGVFDPEANIKRSEFATVICRAMNQSPVGVATFSDVPEDHWAYDYIAWAASQGIVKGKGEGKFDPDANVTYNEAITMIVRAMGYEYYVEEYLNGFPTGYTRIAGSYKMDAGVNTSNGNAAATRADVAMLVYNAFDAPLMDYSYAIGSRDTEYVIYNGSKNVDYEKRTLLSYYSDIYKVKVTVNDTFKTLDTLTDARGNKLMNLTVQSTYGFHKDNESWMVDALGKNNATWLPGGTLNGVIANNEAWASYQGYTVDAYLTLNENDKLEAVAMVPVVAADTELVIENAMEAVTTAEVELDGDVIFEYEDENGKEKDVNIAKGATVYENNKKVGTLAAGEAIEGTDPVEYEYNAATEAFMALVEGAYPSVTLLDSDDNGAYDIIYLTSYIYGIVEDVDADYEIITTTDGAAYELSEDDTKDGFVYTIYKDGAEISISDLAAGDLLNIIIGGDDVANATFVDIYVTNNTIESSVASVSEDDDDTKVYVIDGERYYTAATAMCGELNPGDTGIFYITIDGYIYDAEFTSTYSDNYGFLLDADKTTGAFEDTWQIKILDKNNTVRVLPVKSTLYVSYDGGDNKTSKKNADLDAAMESIAAMLVNEYVTEDDTADLNGAIDAVTYARDEDGNFIDADGNDTVDPDEYVDILNQRLVTFKEVNGEITELVFAYADASKRDFNVATMIDGAYSDKTGRLAGKELLDSTVLFSVPLERAMEETAIYDTDGTTVLKYSYALNFDLIQVYAQSGLVTGEKYNGYIYNVNANGELGAAVLTDDMGFAGNANALAVITSVSKGLDAAGNSAVVLTFIQAGETKSMAINDAYVGDWDVENDAEPGDVFQYTANAAGEIGNATLIYDYSAKAIAEVGDANDIDYVAGLVIENTGKVVTLSSDAGENTYAWDLEDGCTNVLVNTARLAKANGFNTKSGTSYLRATKGDSFNADAYVAVARLDEGVVVDVIGYVYAEEGLTGTTVADFSDAIVGDVTPA